MQTFGREGRIDAPDREDFDSDDAFLREINELRENDRNDLNNLPATEALLQSASAQQNTIINNELGLRDFQDDIDALKQKLTVLEQVRDTANDTRNAIQAASDLEIENNDRDTACLLYTSPSPRDRG